MTFRPFNLLFLLLGLVSFASGQEESQVIGPDVYVEKIEISGREIPLSPILQTDYYHNNLKVFISENIPFPNKYHYRLYNPDVASSVHAIWKPLDKAKIDIFDLPAGNYEFQFMDTEKKPKVTKVAFELIINKAWYRTWWFWGLGFVFLFTMLYGREKYIKSQEEEEQEQQKKIIGLELRTLQLQMNPHFIFNALNSIQSYVISQDTLKANSYLTKFAHLIRMFLDSSRNRYISISEEITLLELYVEMESLRFQNKFDYEITLDEKVDTMTEIPTMILQPFVENAINHGLRYKKNKGNLEISFTDENDFITCTVKDDGVGRKVSRDIQDGSSKGYQSQGLKITEERLATYNKLNKTNIQFSVNDIFPSNHSRDVGTIVIVKFPKNME